MVNEGLDSKEGNKLSRQLVPEVFKKYIAEYFI